MKRQKISLATFLFVLTAVGAQDWSEPKFCDPPPGPGNVDFKYGDGEGQVSFDEEVDGIVTLAKLNYQGSTPPTYSPSSDCSSNLGLSFKLDGEWLIQVKKKQDYETITFYNCDIYVGETKGSIQISINDINDNAPVLTSDNKICKVEENWKGITSCTMQVHDDDEVCPPISYNITESGNLNTSFSIKISDKKNCNYLFTLIVEKDLDYESMPVHVLTITAIDGPLNGSTTMVVNVKDMPDMPPNWVMSSSIYNIIEEEPYELTLKAIDGDIGVNESIKYSLHLDLDQQKYFSVDNDTGIISVTAIDRDILEDDSFKFSAIAYDSLNQSTRDFVFIVNDINDNSPVIASFNTTLVLDEGTTKTFSDITISDPDLADFGTFNVYLQEVEPGNTFTDAFKIIPDKGYQTGSFSIAVLDPTNLDYENDAWKEFSFMLVVIEVADETHTNSSTVTVKLNDVNDEPPIFPKMKPVNVSENAVTGDYITTLKAHDADFGDILTYSTSSTSVNVDPVTGNVTAIGGEFDYERMKEIVIQVQVKDNNTHFGYGELHIIIQDVNDYPPILSMPSSRMTIQENETIGYIITDKIKAKDPDTDADLHFRINWDESSATKEGVQVKKEDYEYSFEMDDSCNCVKEDYRACSCLTLAKNLTWFVMDTISLEVIVRDNNTVVNDAETSAMLVILIQDVNDHAPQFKKPIPTLKIKELSLSGEKIGYVVATDDDGPGNNNVLYSLKETKGTPPNLVKIDATGLLSVDGNKSIVCEKNKQELYYTITATDGENPTPQDITISILDTNDKSPKILNDDPIPIKYIDEESPSGTYVHTVLATDDDVDEDYRTVNYLLNTGANPTIASYFAIDFTSGEITVQLKNNASLLRKETSQYTIPITVVDNFKNPVDSHPVSTNVVVNLNDINNNPPVFPEVDGCLASPPESTKEGEFIKSITATDDDEEPDFKNIIYNITEITDAENVIMPQGFFKLTQFNNQAQILAGRNLTGYVGKYNVKIQGTNPDQKMTGYGTFIICILDENDHYPQITFPPNGEVIRIEDDQETETTIITYDKGPLPPVTATDEDYDDNARVDFKINGTEKAAYYFHVTQSVNQSAELRLRRSLDINSDREFQVIIIASDRGTPTSLSDKTEFTVLVLTKDHEPKFNQSSVNHTFLENATVNSQSFTIPPAIDIDNINRPAGMEDKIYYFILEGNENSLFQLDKDTRKLTVIGMLDYETQKEHILMIGAKNKISDPNGNNELEVIINVQDVNDCAPEFEKQLYIGGIAPGDNPRAQVLKFNATDRDENDFVTYNIVPGTMQANDSLKAHITNGFNLENEVLLLNFAPDVTMSGYFSFKVSATDKVGHSATTDVMVVMISNTNRESFVFENHKEYVDNRTATIENVLTDFLKYICTVEFSATVDTQEVTEHTSVTTHFIDHETNLPVENSIISLLIDEKTSDLKPEFRKYGLNWIDVERQDDDGNPDDLSSLRQTVLIVVCAILATLVLLLLAAFFIRTRRLNQRLEALSQTKFGSQDSGLNRVNMNVPNTNQHALEGSNPVWNEELTNDDNISQGSGDSELVGVEDNPEFRPQGSRKGSNNPYFENDGREWPSPEYPDEQNQNAPTSNFSFGPPQPNSPTTEL